MPNSFPVNFGEPVPGQTNLTATGTNQATALPITQQISVFTTVAIGTGCILPSFPSEVRIVNRGANTLLVYPSGGGTIEDGAANAPISIPYGTDIRLISFPGATAWRQIGRSYQNGHPGYLPSRFYAPYQGQITGGGSTVQTVDTVIYLQLISARDFSLPAVSLNVRTTTGAAGSAVKMAVWASSSTTKRPTGLPFLGSNTGQSTATSATIQTLAVSYNFLPGVPYWFGAAFTTLAPSMHARATTTMDELATIGFVAITSATIHAIRAPYTYATDIMALDLTAATFTDVGSGTGIPILFVGT
jgi:hypothetical protein